MDGNVFGGNYSTSHSFFFDHYPLLINMRKNENWLTMKEFKFEAWWILEESFDTEVKSIWGISSSDQL